MSTPPAKTFDTADPSTGFSIPGYGDFKSINDFVAFATKSLVNLYGLPAALAKLALIPGGIAGALGSEGLTYLQVGLLLAVGNNSLANHLIMESEERKGVKINDVLNSATSKLGPFMAFTKPILGPILHLVGLPV